MIYGKVEPRIYGRQTTETKNCIFFPIKEDFHSTKYALTIIFFCKHKKVYFIGRIEEEIIIK